MISCPNVKVNLGLSVLRRRPDGYHDLETLFVPYFGFHDTLEIIAGDDYSRTSARLFEGALPPTIPRGLSAFPTFAAQKSRPGRPADAGFASLKSPDSAATVIEPSRVSGTGRVPVLPCRDVPPSARKREGPIVRWEGSAAG